MTFPLQNLPFLAFKNVVHQFRINDLLDMTMTSDIFKKRVEEFKIKIEILSWDYPNIVTINSFDTMTFYIYTDPEVTNKSKKVNNTLVNLRKNHGGPNRDSGAISTHFRFYHDETQTNLEIQEELIIHLLSIFNVDEYHLDWNPFVGSILDSYVWKYCKNFYCLMVNGPREEWTPEEMEFVMTEIKSEILEWTGNSHAYKFRGKLDTETMVLRIEEGESWFTQEALLLADFQTLELYGAMTAAELDLNVFIKNWLTRRDDKLETFDITLVRDGFSTVGIQITGILHDIQTTGTHFQPNELRARCLHRDECLFSDVKRSTDGRIATILLHENEFHFLVWTDEKLRLTSEITRERVRRFQAL